MTSSVGAARPSPPRLSTVLWLSMLWLVLVSVLLCYDATLAAFTPLGKLDFRLGYSSADVSELFRAYGLAGRAVYQRLTWVDMVFAVVVGAWGNALARATQPPTARTYQLACWAPWAFALCDVVENALILTLLTSPERPLPWLVQVASVTTSLKLAALLLTYTVALVAALRSAVAVVFGKPSPLRVRPLRGGFGLGHVLGLSLAALLLGVIQSCVFNGTEAPRWIRAVVPEGVCLADGAYDRFGRLFLPVVLAACALVPGWVAHGRRLHCWLQRLFLAALVGDFVTYWVAGLAHPGLRAISFWGIEVPAWLSIIGLVSVHGWFGGEPSQSKRQARLSVALVPVTILCVAALQYLPHAFVPPVVLVAGLSRSWGSKLSLREAT